MSDDRKAIEYEAALDLVERRIRASLEVPEVGGDFIPLRVLYDRQPCVVCVGIAGGGTARVQVNGHDCALVVEDGWARWTSPPLRYYPGLRLAVRYEFEKGTSSEWSTELPGPDALGPVFGPDWTSFGPGRENG